MTSYPDGKISDDDLGEADLAITVRDKTVIVAFAKPMNWIGMNRATAIAFGRALIAHAEKIREGGDRCQ